MNNNLKKIDHVIIPAAGFGTRLLPASKCIPKEMFTIVNMPAIEYIANEIVEAELNTMILVTSKNKDSLVDHFDRNFELEVTLKNKNKDLLLNSILKFKNLNFINIRQREALGLGHAVLTCQEALGDNPFVVILPDMMIKNGSQYLKKMLDIYNKTGKGVIALMKVPHDRVSSYGIIDGNIMDDKTVEITDMIEKPNINEAPTNLAIVGRYILPNKVLKTLDETKPGSGNEIQLTDSLKKLAIAEGMIGIIIEDEIHDIGNPLGFVKANISYCLDHSKHKNDILDYIKEIASKY